MMHPASNALKKRRHLSLSVSASISAPIGLVAVAPMIADGPLKTGEPAVEVAVQHERRQLSQLGYAGKMLFRQNCVECHGEEAKGSRRGTSLVTATFHRENFDKRSFHRAVREGESQQVASLGMEHAFSDLSFNQVEQLERYLRELQKPFDFQ